MKSFVAPVLLITALALGVGAWFFFHDDPEKGALATREMATRGLAEHLARRFPGQRALVISNPFTQEKNIDREIKVVEEAGVRGLRRGFGNGITVEAVAFPELKPGALQNPRGFVIDPQTTTPLSYLVAEDAFDKLVKQHPGCGLFVSLIGLPADLSKVESWPAPDAPKFALLLPDLRVVGDTQAVRDAMKAGKIAAFVANKPGAPPEHLPAGKDFAAEFERRFLLVTPENIDEVIQKWPQLF